jgi:aldehyde dehydrogenase (NAD+)
MDICALTFTGSGATGRAIQVAAARSNFKHLILELGGKSPAIIFEDADLLKAVEETQNSIKWNSGQVCMANSRIYIQKSVAEKFISEFKDAYALVRAGNPTDPSVDYGPVVDDKQYNTVLGHIEQAKQEGALILGGTDTLSSLGGYFIEPTIFVDMPELATIMKTEVFGPVVVINTFTTEEEAIQKANDSEFGLYASVYTNNLNRALRMAKALDAGTVAVNCTSPTGALDMPQGGYKSSGVGRESRIQGMEHFMETKSVLIKVDNL